MVITSDVLQKSKSKITTRTELENNTDSRNHDTSCNNVDCIFKPISRCTLCSEFYCYGHASQHAHSMDNFEILK
ncbi:hypothetical protein [Candidatus Nitrosocosmicus arcticus]|uniref:hypothetical protein n=1 Tax=Candidatus Nitrosocosmicus arcticus TaxID=2035267 RepID=UPI0011A42519|nr:hypothetical protein [Candidatus Nitrosocosmicus arcticus]